MKIVLNQEDPIAYFAQPVDPAAPWERAVEVPDAVGAHLISVTAAFRAIQKELAPLYKQARAQDEEETA